MWVFGMRGQFGRPQGILCVSTIQQHTPVHAPEMVVLAVINPAYRAEEALLAHDRKYDCMGGLELCWVV